ncbi:hypothetical protein M2305_002219 [Gluconobacter cerinus]|uniref:hypothetical protein n=1 Tax=Gluconobacter cerinus TaxID=38307 RepID=UPI002226189E|nr:hypothetical protein [Gluconobacter cerinus]MCW2266272.1 hypothetical protein [Gluconobacter cerinus]
MKIIHAVIRKLRPRARHPDGVRNTEKNDFLMMARKWSGNSSSSADDLRHVLEVIHTIGRSGGSV